MVTMLQNIMEQTHALVVLVMDGATLPLKYQTDNERRQAREENMKLYHELKNVDKTAARNHLVKAFSFSNE